jgi:hypothetical protein
VTAFTLGPKRQPFIKRHRVFATATGIFVAFSLGIAVAAFVVTVLFSGGNSGGAHTTGGINGVTAQSTPSTGEQAVALAPGDTGPIYLRVGNASLRPLHLKSWTPEGIVIVSSDGPCDASNFSLNTVGGLNVPVPIGSSVIEVPGALSFVNTPQDGCSNAVVTTNGNAVFGF